MHLLSGVIPTWFLCASISSAFAVPSLIPRKAVAGSSFVRLYEAIKEYLEPQNAYDADVSGKCALYFGTVSGGNCFMNVQCERTDAHGPALPANNVCYKGGRQYFHVDQIGDFSVTYSKAGGIEGDKTDGLHSPILQFANINNWEPLDLDTLIAAQGDRPGKLCTSGKVSAQQELFWQCGVPVAGEDLFGISNYLPVVQSTYKPGWCTMHVVQWQRNENGVGADYAFDVLIYDADQKQIGLVAKAPIDPVTKSLSVTSVLPYTVEIRAPGADEDPVQFAYADQAWDGNDRTVHQSNMGTGPEDGYENGNREGDMGFNCPAL